MIYLLDVLVHNGVSEETLRFSTHPLTTSTTDTPANTFYNGTIKDPGKFSQVLFEGGRLSGRAGISYGFVELINMGALDVLFSYGWGRQCTLKWLSSKNAPISGAETLAIGTVIGIDSSGAGTRLSLRLRDRLAELDKPLLTVRYAGTTLSAGATAEGDETLTDRLKPYVFGSAKNVLGILVNRFDLLYQFAANSVASLVCYDGGILIPSVGDFPVLESLVAATVPAGSCATCFAQGIARYGAAPALDPTADVVEGASAALRSASAVGGRILDLAAWPSADRNSTSFDALHSFNSAEVGIYLNDETTILDALSQVFDSVGGVLIANESGVLEVPYVAEPSTTVDATFTLRDIGKELSITPFVGATDGGQGIPAWSVDLNWGRIWHTQAESALHPVVEIARKTLLKDKWRKVVSSDVAIKTMHPLAEVLTFDTLLTEQSTALAEAARRLALYKVRRDRVSIPTSDALGNIALGGSVKVQMQRFEYAAGRNFIVVGKEFDRARNRIALALWG